MCEVARSTDGQVYVYTHVHIYPCLIFLWEINAVIKIRKNELITLQMDNQLGPEDCREHVLCWYSIWFRGFSWGNWYFIHAFLEIICSNLLALSVCKMYFFKNFFEILLEIYLNFILNLAGWCYGSVFIFLFFLHDGLQIPPMQSSCQQICKLYHIFYVCQNCC